MQKNEKHTVELLPLLQQFIKSSQKGHRRKADGNRLTGGTVDNYTNCYRLLNQFCESRQFTLRLRLFNRLNKRDQLTEKNYWKKFYRQFTDYLYNDLDLYDNYVGSVIKSLRTFFNYLAVEKQLPVGLYHKQFFIPKEDIPVIALTTAQLQFLIHDHAFEQSLSAALQRTKDVFVFGCTVGLRYSDLYNLTRANIEQQPTGWYVKVNSQKTNTYTSVLLPQYAVDILCKYTSRKRQALPVISKFNFNKQLKQLAEKAGWVHNIMKTRQKRGKASLQADANAPRFCDVISSHTMRRTAITTLLTLGMPELMVRKVSGHAPNSKEFFKYVALSQQRLDEETMRAYNHLASNPASTPPIAAT